MSRKRKPWWLPEAIRLSAEGRSVREIAEIVGRSRKKGQKGPSHASVHNYLRALKGPPEAGDAPPPPAPPPPPEPLDESPMEPEDLVGLLTGLLRQQTALAQRLSADGDQQGAQRATRTATSIAAQLAKQQAREDNEGDVVRVKASDMQAAADRAVQGLHALTERVLGERAAWPRCTTCGQPSGAFPDAEKSPVRALVERIFGAPP